MVEVTRGRGGSGAEVSEFRKWGLAVVLCYRNDHKFSDRSVWANSADPDS